MSVFNTDSVTVIRRRGDCYLREEINTAPVLPGAARNREQVRARVIDRLRKDPSVVFVLEDRDGRADEKAILPDEFEMSVSLVDGESPSASLTVSHKGFVVFNDEFTQEEEGNEPVLRSVTEDLADTVIDILTCIDGKDYSFAEDDGSHFTLEEPGEEVTLYGAKHILDAEGFQTESIRTVGTYNDPFLFVHENEVVLMGSRRFDGVTLYLEMKRLFVGVPPTMVRKAVEKTQMDSIPVEIIEREDGSWSFRVEMDADTDADNFMEKLLSDITLLKEAIARVEDEDGIGEEIWSIMENQRQLFIYEVIDSSVKLKNLNI